MAMMPIDFQAYAGPGDKGLRHNELEGYQPVSRIGEVVMNSFGTLCAFALLLSPSPLECRQSVCTVVF